MVVQEIFSNHYHCSECRGSIVVDTSRGESTCCQCGLVHQDKLIDFKAPEKRSFPEIGKIKKPRNHRRLIFDTNVRRILEKDKWIHSTFSTRTQITRVYDINRMCQSLQLPEHVQSFALRLFRESNNKGLLVGRAIALSCSCVYYSCRYFQVPISFNEIIAKSTSDEKRIRKAYILLTKAFDYKLPILSPEIFLTRYASDLGLKFTLEKKVLEILHSLPKSYILGKDPKCICAGLLYLFSSEKNLGLSQAKICRIVGISLASLRIRYHEIRSLIDKNK